MIEVLTVFKLINFYNFLNHNGKGKAENGIDGTHIFRTTISCGIYRVAKKSTLQLRLIDYLSCEALLAE